MDCTANNTQKSIRQRMIEIRKSYDSQVRPVIARLDEIAELRKRYVELPDDLKIERKKLQDEWYEIGTEMWTKFKELGEG